MIITENGEIQVTRADDDRGRKDTLGKSSNIGGCTIHTIYKVPQHIDTNNYKEYNKTQ